MQVLWQKDNFDAGWSSKKIGKRMGKVLWLYHAVLHKLIFIRFKIKIEGGHIMNNFWDFFKKLFKVSDRQVKAMRFDPGNISRRYVHRSTQAKRRKLERRGCR